MDQQRLIRLRTMPYEEYLQTPEWAKKRDQAVERDGHCCRTCNSDEKLQVHHRTYARRGDEDLNDLTTLCQSCHEHFHTKIWQEDLMARTYEAPETPKSKEEVAQQWEDYLIGLLLKHPSLLLHVRGILSEEDDLAGSDTRALYQVLCAASDADQPFEQVIPAELQETVTRAVKLVEMRAPKDGTRLEKEAIQCTMRIKRTHLIQLNLDLQYRIRDAFESGNKTLLQQLEQQLTHVQLQLRTMSIATHLAG